jgi:hypothetical protein
MSGGSELAGLYGAMIAGQAWLAFSGLWET